MLYHNNILRSPIIVGVSTKSLQRVALRVDVPEAVTRTTPEHQKRIIMMSTTTTTQSHYTNHDATSYESAYFYEPGQYMEHIKNLVQTKLGITPVLDSNSLLSSTGTKTKRLLDIGGGTGNFTKSITDYTTVYPIVIDPFLEGSSNDTDESITYIHEPAEAFINNDTMTPEQALWKENYDYVLLKEVVHHFRDQDRAGIFRGIYHGLNKSTTPSLLIITRPQNDIDYPLWEEARIVWAKNQQSDQQFIQELSDAGFSNIEATIETYPCSIPLQRWQQMIQNRFWSTFSNFTNDELEKACQHIATAEKDRIRDGIIYFEDRLVFITACKV